jgi:hypothetical protein
MKVTVKGLRNKRHEEDIETVNSFLKFLQDEAPLKNDIKVDFVSEKNENMTTGVRFGNSHILVLDGKRMLIDVLRTLAHEWVHEFQHQQLGLSEKAKIQNIGGPVENMCNILAGIFIKKFEKKFPKYQKSLYGEL